MNQTKLNFAKNAAAMATRLSKDIVDSQQLVSAWNARGYAKGGVNEISQEDLGNTPDVMGYQIDFTPDDLAAFVALIINFTGAVAQDANVSIVDKIRSDI